MAEETKDPSKIFPKVLLTGLLITVVIYVLVSISAVTLVSPAELGQGEAPLLKVVAAGAPGFPLWVFGIITMFAVANSALINMLMASRLLHREGPNDFQQTGCDQHDPRHGALPPLKPPGRPGPEPVERGRTWPRRAQVGMPRARSTTGRRPSAGR
jgi:hypothetical protein